MTLDGAVNFKASTLKVLGAIDEETLRRLGSCNDENYLLHQIVVSIRDKIYTTVDEHTYRNGLWHVDTDVVAALREALLDSPQPHPGQAIANLLARTGITDREVLKRLHPWEYLMFRWQDDAFTASDVAAILQHAGVGNNIPESDHARMDAWIANPHSALDHSYDVLGCLFDFKHRGVFFPVRDIGYELPHDALFQQLLARAAPPVEVENVAQIRGGGLSVALGDPIRLAIDNVGDDRPFKLQLSGDSARVYESDSVCKVSFEYGGKQHAFLAEGNGTWMDVPAVLNAVDALMASIGRPERAFQIQEPREGNSEWGFFIVADAMLFDQAMTRLGIPISVKTVSEPANGLCGIFL